MLSDLPAFINFISIYCSFLRTDLCDDVALDVAVVVLAGPNESSGALQGLRYHVVDQSVLVANVRLLELRFIFPELKNNNK